MKLLFISAILALPFTFFAQSTHHHNPDEVHSHEMEEHKHNGFEIGIGTGAVYSIHENKTAAGLHLHGLYNLDPLVLGLGFESVFLKENHFNLSGIIGFRPIESFEISVAPGILLKNDETGKNLLSLHAEAVYLFEIEKIGHLGPVISYAKAGDDQHVMVGLHFGFHF